MNKRILISEEEKRRILDMHKSLSLKPILEQYSKEKDILNEKGQYIAQAKVTFKGQEIGQEGGFGHNAHIKTGTVVWGDQRFNAITFWNSLTNQTKYKELLTIKCDSNKVIGKWKDDSGSWVDKYEYIYTDPIDFIPKMKSMFCCGTQLKPDTDRPGSKAWAKPGEDGYKCKGSQVSPTKKCAPGIAPCATYKDCSQSQHYHKCDKCEKIKEVQRCLAKKFPTLGIKDDGYWGCKTQEALNQLKMGESLTPEQITMLCTETLG